MTTDGKPELRYCRDCETFRAVGGQAGFECDVLHDCPRSDQWGGRHNCGHVVCAECHELLSDHHLTPSLSDR